MSEPDFTVAIIGLGLIGGSLARGLAAQGARVLGYDRDVDTLGAALASGAVASPLSASFEESAAADAIVLAVPVTDSPALLPRIGRYCRTDALLTDVGSTKQTITAAALAAGLAKQFVGSHPLAGDHRSGWHAARPELFAGMRVFLCPTDESAPASVDRALALWRLVGGEPLLISPSDHDRLVAWTSHLPQAAAYALAAALADAGIPRAALGPGGRDTMRLAASPAELWTGIALDNAGALAPALAATRASLEAVEQALLAGNRERLHELFAAGRAWYGET